MAKTISRRKLLPILGATLVAPQFMLAGCSSERQSGAKGSYTTTVPGIAKDGDEPTPSLTATPTATATKTPVSVDDLIKGIHPQVQDYLRTLEWIGHPDDTQTLLLRFLKDASGNSIFKTSLPLMAVPNTSNPIQYKQLSADNQLAILKNGLFGMYPLPEGPRLMVISSTDLGLTRAATERFFSLGAEYLPKVEALAGPTPYPYLHLQRESIPNHSIFSTGSNIYLMRPEEIPSYESQLSHEDTHRRSAKYAQENPQTQQITRLPHPLCFHEGFADYVAFTLTGDTRDYRRFANNGKVDLNLRNPPSRDQYRVESGNGTLFVSAMAEEIGQGAMSSAIKEAFKGAYAGSQVLDIIRSNAPGGTLSGLESVISRWT